MNTKQNKVGLLFKGDRQSDHVDVFSVDDQDFAILWNTPLPAKLIFWSAPHIERLTIFYYSLKSS